jgi:transcriptional regulator with XRE-family HTH domain
MAASSRPRSPAQQQAVTQIRSYLRAGLSQRQTARITGYSRRTIRDIAAGRRGVSPAGAVRVTQSARELSASADLLVDGKLVHFDYMTDAEKAVAHRYDYEVGRARESGDYTRVGKALKKKNRKIRGQYLEADPKVLQEMDETGDLADIFIGPTPSVEAVAA